METATKAGADLIGMVFIPTAQRYINPDQARAFVSALREAYSQTPTLVGLFADQDPEEVNYIASHVGLDRIQLCGNEGPKYWALTEYPLMQVLHIPEIKLGHSFNQDETINYLFQKLSDLDERQIIGILDGGSPLQPGGTGKTIDWSLARELSDQGGSFVLAGGLTTENVDEAIRRTRPKGVDVSTGIETNGIKDSAKIRSFIKEAQQALRTRKSLEDVNLDE